MTWSWKSGPQKSLNPVGTPGLWSRRWPRRLRDKQREWHVSAEILHTVNNLVSFAVLQLVAPSYRPLEPATAPPIPGLTVRCFVRFVICDQPVAYGAIHSCIELLIVVAASDRSRWQLPPFRKRQSRRGRGNAPQRARVHPTSPGYLFLLWRPSVSGPPPRARQYP